MKPFHKAFALILALLTYVGTIATAHTGVPLDPGITEDSPRKYSELYLERKDLPWTMIEEGVEFQTIREGSGAMPMENATVFVLWRMFDQKDGREIFYRVKHGTEDFIYNEEILGSAIGGGGTLRAVQLVLKDMREGGKTLVKISAEKSFGREGWSDSHFVVPPNMDMVIELSLIWVRKPDPKRFTFGEPHPRPAELEEAAEQVSLNTAKPTAAASKDVTAVASKPESEFSNNITEKEDESDKNKSDQEQKTKD